MRKTIAYFLSIFSFFILGLTVLHPSFRALADWLGPLTGSYIYTFFMFIYLLLADPFRYPLVTTVWVILGVFIGVIVGKKLGAALTAVLVYLTSIPLLGSSIAGIYFSLESRGVFNEKSIEALRLIPIIPEQLTFNSLFNIPIFSDLVFQVFKIMPTISEQTDPVGVMLKLATPHLIALASKPIILILCAVIGTTVSGLIFEGIGKLLPTRKAAYALLLITILALQTAPVYAVDLNDGVYIEFLGGYVEEQNRAIIGEVLLGNTIEYLPMNTPETSGLVASIVFTQKIYDPAIFYTLPTEGLSDYLHFRNLIPSTFAVNVYLGDDSENIESKSNMVMETLESNLGIALGHVLTTELPSEGGSEASMPTMTAVAYYSSSTIEETTSNILPPFSLAGGFSGFIEEKLTSGTPLGVEFNATGVIKLEPFEAILPIPEVPEEYQAELDTLLQSELSFLLGVQLTEDATDPLGTGYVFDLRDTLGVSSVPVYSPESDASFIIIGRSNRTGVTDLLDPTVFIKTSLPESSTELNLLTMLLSGMGAFQTSTGTPTSQDTRIIVPELTPPPVTVTKTSTLNGDRLQVTVTATNNGDTTINDLKLSDSFPLRYGELVAGTTTASWSTLSPSASQSLSYTVELVNPGSYTDTPAILRYSLDDTPSSVASNTVPSVEKSPSPVTMLADSYTAITAILELLTGRGDLLGIALLGIVLLVAAIDVIRYLAKPKRDESPQSEEAPPAPPQEPEDTDVNPL